MVENKMNAHEVIEASSLGWRPGYFATYFEHSLTGVGGWNRVRTERDHEGDILAVHYLNAAGERLVVLND